MFLLIVITRFFLHEFFSGLFGVSLDTSVLTKIFYHRKRNKCRVHRLICKLLAYLTPQTGQADLRYSQVTSEKWLQKYLRN